MINFEQLLSDRKSEQFKTLRESQKVVLDAYAANHSTTPDLAIELPTGAGKSLIATLIGKSKLDEGKKVAILCGNKQLAAQFHEQALSLNIPSVLFSGSGASFSPKDLREYNRGQALGIMNYWVYYNQSPRIPAADLLILDDAHLAEGAIGQLFAIKISKKENAELFRLIVTELAKKYPQYTNVVDIAHGVDNQHTAADLIIFNDFYEFIPWLISTCDSSPLVTDSNLRFSWQRMRAHLKKCLCLVSRHSVEFRPYIFPTQSIPHHTAPSQRIYMSATIGALSDLQRRLGTNEIVSVGADRSYSRKIIGRRLIFAAQSSSDQERILKLYKEAAVSRKSVWLCSSLSFAERMKARLGQSLYGEKYSGYPPIFCSGDDDSAIDAFVDAPAGHLVVGGRFDGMDFPHDVCRVVVIPEIPIATNVLEQFLAAYLSDASFLMDRLSQRIRQAFGRATRDDSDYAVYFLSEPNISQLLMGSNIHKDLPQKLLSELDASQDNASLDFSKQSCVLQEFLSGNFATYDAWVKDQATTPSVEASDPEANAEVQSWLDMWSENYSGAAALADTAFTKSAAGGQLAYQAWWAYIRAWAAFLKHRDYHEDIGLSQSWDALSRALNCGRASSFFNRLHRALAKIKGEVIAPVDPDAWFLEAAVSAWDKVMRMAGLDPSRRTNWLRETEAYLNSSNHSTFCQGLERLGLLMAFAVKRPKGSAATDCQWQIGGPNPFVLTIEAKIENKTSTEIDRDDVNQAGGQVRELEKTHKKVYGVIVTHLAGINSPGSAALGPIRLFHKDLFVQILQRIGPLFERYASERGQINRQISVGLSIELKKSFPSPYVFSEVISSSKGAFIENSEIFSRWPK